MKKLTTDEIRNIWLDFWKSKQHLELPSKSLIPINDPTLLWINSGVATLKRYFAGIEAPPSPRMCNSQKAIRTNDIENVGVTARHHTFFEMLGNFSIGDYFKKDAINWGYELLTKYFEINPSLLYITVYEKDEESYQCWINVGINQKHIIKCNKQRNFWEIGEGPCGPCTEVYYDRGEKYDSKKLGEELFFKDIENDRYVEIWNIVFSQYKSDGKGNYTDLPKKNVDTGAGLERLASISQQVDTDFDADNFINIIRTLEKSCQVKYDLDKKDYKTIIDHLKTCTFAIADGAYPSNKERGYIIRRLIRRSMVAARKLGLDSKTMVDVCISMTIDNMKSYYPYLINQKQHIEEVIYKEEESFSRTINDGFKIIDKLTTDIDGHILFDLFTTYGFPVEMTVEIASEKGIAIKKDAIEEYKKEYKHHQDISRGFIKK